MRDSRKTKIYNECINYQNNITPTCGLQTKFEKTQNFREILNRIQAKSTGFFFSFLRSKSPKQTRACNVKTAKSLSSYRGILYLLCYCHTLNRLKIWDQITVWIRKLRSCTQTHSGSMASAEGRKNNAPPSHPCKNIAINKQIN